MHMIARGAAVTFVFTLLQGPDISAAQRQNPSPMVETTRAHERLHPVELNGRSLSIPGGERDVDIFVPGTFTPAAPVTLVLHFHGAAWIPEQAVARLQENVVAAVVDLGAGSTTYDREISDPGAFPDLVDGVMRAVGAVAGADVALGDVVLSAFSAGHGAIRAILRDSANFATVGSVLLMDGMHTSYVPEGTVLANGGRLDETNLAVFVDFARAAVAGEKRFLITHSEIFPGTFASTTETADWLLDVLRLRRTAVLEWGPRGMQQLSVAASGGFELLGYAGNSAPDHVDHFHAMPELLEKLLR